MCYLLLKVSVTEITKLIRVDYRADVLIRQLYVLLFLSRDHTIDITAIRLH